MKKSVNTLLVIWTTIFAVIALASLACCIFLLVREEQEESIGIETQVAMEETIEEPSEEEIERMIESACADARVEAAEAARQELLGQIKESLLADSSSVRLLRALFPEDIIFYYRNQYYFEDINEHIEKNTYQDEAFSMGEDGRLSYGDENGISSHFGIDVSKFQGKIDWVKVKECGVEFAIIRLGLRGYTEGAIVEDSTYVDNMEGALSQDIHTGVYFFTQAINADEIQEELDFVLEHLKDYDIDGPIVVDVEDVGNGNSRTGCLSASERTELIRQFCEGIKDAGYRPMIYSNLRSIVQLVDLEQLEEYEMWFACYELPVYYPYRYSILQYSETGSIPGIREPVDLNIILENPWW